MFDDAVLNSEPIWKMNTASGSTSVSRVGVPVASSDPETEKKPAGASRWVRRLSRSLMVAASGCGSRRGTVVRRCGSQAGV